MDVLVVFEKVALALGLGLLVGLQRERVQSPLAGIRTVISAKWELYAHCSG
jgi:uncharacterized membrane protein YhiD involved in acid resistance